MKRAWISGALVVAALTQAGCGTELKTLPLPAAGGEVRGGVPVYFGQQNHPAVKRQLGEVSYSTRIARKELNPDDACREALGESVGKLRAAAQERNANAVIDVSTRFHSTDSVSSTEFTCGFSPSAAAISVSGKLVVLEAN